jgi:hypothetical protein
VRTTSYSEAGDDKDPDESMRIRVHWFTRPAQLAGTRQKRESLLVSLLSAYFELVDQTTCLWGTKFTIALFVDRR